MALNRSTTLMDDVAAGVWRSLHPAGAEHVLAERRALIDGSLHAEAVLEGSGTFLADDAGPPAGLPPADVAASTLLEHHLPGPADCRWFVVVDSRGRIRWTYTGDATTRLLVLVSRSTPTEYLAYLRRQGIPYVVAGSGRVDLPLALDLLGELLGVTCVVSEAGGGLNGALLRAGLVDELHLVLLPSLIGGRDIPSTFDGAPLLPGAAPDTAPSARRAQHTGRRRLAPLRGRGATRMTRLLVSAGRRVFAPTRVRWPGVWAAIRRQGDRASVLRT